MDWSSSPSTPPPVLTREWGGGALPFYQGLGWVSDSKTLFLNKIPFAGSGIRIFPCFLETQFDSAVAEDRPSPGPSGAPQESPGTPWDLLEPPEAPWEPLGAPREPLETPWEPPGHPLEHPGVSWSTLGTALPALQV